MDQKIQDQKTGILLPIRDPLWIWRHIKLRVGGWKKIFYAKGTQKKARVVTLISDKIRLLNKDSYKRQRTLHNDQRINSRRNITTVNIYAPNIETSQYIRQMLTDIKGEIDSNTIFQQHKRRLYTWTSPDG